jgi:hypothetical protein
VTAPDDPLTVRDYLDLMLAGSFPEPSLRIPVTARRRWFAGYVEQMITRDVPASHHLVDVADSTKQNWSHRRGLL